MDVVLLERVEKLGQMGDVVSVKDGYARNFLLPQGKALRANKNNLARFEAERAQLEAQNLERKAEADRVGADLDGQQFIVIRSASEAGALYGSVTTRDVAETVTEGGITISKGQIRLDKPVKELGLHAIKVVLHPEVSVEIIVNVARSEEEAAIQATGKSIQDVRADEDAETEFDLADLFDDMGAAANEELDDGPAPVIETSDEEATDESQEESRN
ncbi:MAG: 50S ribosomal protein L9 [Pseudomonadota bacterium]